MSIIRQNLIYSKFLLTSLCLVGLLSNLTADWKTSQEVPKVNTTEDEYSPFVLERTQERDQMRLLFLSSGADSRLSVDLLSLEGKPVVDIHFSRLGRSYISLRNDRLFTSMARQDTKQMYINLGVSQRTKNSFYSALVIDSLECDCYTSQPAISGNGELLAFSSNRYNDDLSDTDIWIARRIDANNWGQAYSFDMINTQFKETTPFFKGDTLFFASEGFGGPGGLDLYRTTLENGIWSRPISLGINTEYNESDPFVCEDGTLYFASDKAGSVGGYDLYYSIPDPTELPSQSDSSLELLSYTGQYHIKKNDSYVSIPLPDVLSFESKESMAYNFDQFVYNGTNILIKGLINYADRINTSVGQTPDPIRIVTELPNVLEGDSEKNYKYYADQRIRHLYDTLSIAYNSSHNRALSLTLSELFDAHYVVSDMPTPPLESKLESAGHSYTYSNTIYTGEPGLLAFTLQGDSLTSETRWRIESVGPDTAFVAEGNSYPSNPIEYIVGDRGAVYESNMDRLIFEAKLLTGGADGEIVGKSRYGVELTRSIEQYYTDKQTEEGVEYSFYFTLQQPIAKAIESIQTYIGSRMLAADSFTLCYNRQYLNEKSTALKLRNFFVDEFKNKGAFLSTSGIKEWAGGEPDAELSSWTYRIDLKIPIVTP